MTLPRLYLPRPLEKGDVCEMARDQAHYLEAVLRLGEGQKVVVFNGGDREYEAVLRPGSEGRLALEIVAERIVARSDVAITLCQAVPKGEKMDVIVRHATELGAERIVSFWATRSVPRWTALKAGQKRDRWQKIAQDAARQCGRLSVPEVMGPHPFPELAAHAPADALRLVFWEGERELGIREILTDKRHARMKNFFLVVGPEGGLSDQEVALAREAGFLSVSLGRRILRVETAALAILAVVQYERGGWAVPGGEG